MTTSLPATDTSDSRARMGLRESTTFDRSTIAAIQRAAETGIYDIRGWGAKRPLPPVGGVILARRSMPPLLRSKTSPSAWRSPFACRCREQQHG